MRFEVGHLVRVEFSKWGGHRHWEYDGVYLGVDDHGEWIGHPVGTPFGKPGRDLVAEHAYLTLAPRRDAAHVVTFNAAGHDLDIYVDITTPPEWGDTTLRMVDLDLDIVRPRDGRETFIDDEDEFADHQVSLGYPPDVVTMARRSADRMLAEVRSAVPPYDGTADRWFEVLGSLTST